jgi:hypothetical protein
MPVMLRKKGKAAKIALSIMGVPQNMQQHKSVKKARINQRLVFEDTTRMR